MQIKLPKPIIVELERMVDGMFNRLLARLLGGGFTGKSLFLSVQPTLSLPSLFARATTEEGGYLDKELLQNLSDVVIHLVDKQRSESKAAITRRIQSILQDVRSGHISPEDFKNHLESELIDMWGRITSNVERVVNTETQHAVTLGLKDGIEQANLSRGIVDPVYAFLVKNDAALCNECRRLHLMPDNTTPRAWLGSEISSDYHKRGEDKPSFHLLHPNCFTGDVRIHTGEGPIAIKELFLRGGENKVVVDSRVKKTGDEVFFDFSGTGVELKPASYVYYTGIKKCLRISFSSGQNLPVSIGHEMWVCDGGCGRKIRADQLRIGSKVPIISGDYAEVSSIEPIGQHHTYCLTEPETNTVTANGIVTGNCRCSLITLLPGFGFNGSGRVTYIKDGFKELQYQRSSDTLGGVEERRQWAVV